MYTYHNYIYAIIITSLFLRRLRCEFDTLLIEVEAGHHGDHMTTEIKECLALIRSISRELRYLESEFYKLYLCSVLSWLFLFILAEKSESLRSLPVRVLSISQALEVVLIASGDVEENPGPTFLDGKLVVTYCM